MRRRTYLRTVTMAMPGLFLTGWAPARASERLIQLQLHDVARGADAQSLRAGAELGLEDVHHVARLLQVPLVVHRSSDLTASPGPGCGVQVVVADHDDGQGDRRNTRPLTARVYTCPLSGWRRGVWSVASRPCGDPQLDWHPALDTPAAAQLSERFAQRAGEPMGEAAWRGWMAVKAGFEMALRAEAGEDDPLALRLDGHKGQPLRFAEDGHLVQPTCRVVAGRAALAVPGSDRLAYAN